MKTNKNTRPSISVFFPFLNDWGTVGSLVGLAVDTVSKLTDDWEVLIINDGSKKEDREALESIVRVLMSLRGADTKTTKKSHSNQKSASSLNQGIASPRHEVGTRNDNSSNRIRIINHEKNRGYGGALRSGFENAAKDIIFYTDCDAQYDPRELKKLHQALKPDTGMVNGYKIKRQDPLVRIVAGRLYHYIVKFMFRLPIRDTDCDFRLIRREVFIDVRLFENTGTICVELVKKIDHAGYKIAQVPVHHFWRTSGKSQFFNFPRLYKTGTNLLRLWWKLMIRRDYNH